MRFGSPLLFFIAGFLSGWWRATDPLMRDVNRFVSDMGRLFRNGGHG
jgi:hypothetical protein